MVAAVPSVATAPPGAPGATAAPILYWYDPMEPGQHFDHPGKSPFMDMELVPKYAEPASAAAAGSGKEFVVSPDATQSLGMRLARVERGVVQSSLSLPGIVQFNDRDVAVVQLRSAGFVQKVYNHAVDDVIAAGAPLVDLLVPDWAGAQEEFLAVLRTGDPALGSAARQRLGLLGMPDALIERVTSSRQIEPVLTLRAPLGGVLTELSARSGMSLAQGMTVARINGIQTVWVEVSVPEAESAAVQTGQAARISFSARPGQVLTGRVSALLPQTDVASRSLRARVELANPGGQLRPGQFAQVQLLPSDARPALLVPSEAVIRTGVRSLVMVSTGHGRFRPVEVTPGQDGGDRTVILSGLKEGDTVVASGQFLLDSEASLRGLTAPASPDELDRTKARPPGAAP